METRVSNSLNVAAILTVGLAGAAEEAPAPGSLLPGGEERWELVWSDEFDGTGEDLDRTWESQNGPSGHILCSRWRDNVEISQGTLKLLNRREKRGGQEWTSGSIWTREKFQYGYFECRYRYAAATGTNNSFWLTTRGPNPAAGKRFEVDINEGHYPNEVNTNIHNWSDVTVVDGRRSHPSDSKHFSFGVQPDRVIELEIPVTTRRIRFVSKHPRKFHIGEFRIFAPGGSGYPGALMKEPKAGGPINFARDPQTSVKVSGFYKGKAADGTKRLVDGDPRTSWISQEEGGKWIEFSFSEERSIGCIQFTNGWKDRKGWRDMIEDYLVQYHDGSNWVDLARFDVADEGANFARDFHTFGLEWNETDIVFLLDGKELHRDKNEFCFSSAPIFLSLAITKWAGVVTNAIDGTRMEVDYVRVYKPKEAPRAARSTRNLLPHAN